MDDKNSTPFLKNGDNNGQVNKISNIDNHNIQPASFFNKL